QIGQLQAEPRAVGVVVGDVPLALTGDEEDPAGAGKLHALEQVLRDRLGLAVRAFGGGLESHRQQFLAARKWREPAGPAGRGNQSDHRFARRVFRLSCACHFAYPFARPIESALLDLLPLASLAEAPE